MDGRRWTVDGGRWTVDGGRWTVDGGRGTVDGGRVKLKTSNSKLQIKVGLRLREERLTLARIRCAAAEAGLTVNEIAQNANCDQSNLSAFALFFNQFQFTVSLPGYRGVLFRPADEVRHYVFNRSEGNIFGYIVALLGHIEGNVVTHAV